MKKVLQLLFVFLTINCFGQKTAVIVNSPASLEGEKVFGGADFGADLSSKLWTGDLVMASPNLGCTALTNAAEINGKICVIDRGTCLFDVKAQSAKDAGAIALIVMNHNDQSNRGGPPFQMGGTAAVDIPVVMLSYNDGVAIKEAMKTGTVNVTLGGFPKEDYDLAISRSVCDGTLTQPNAVHPIYGCFYLSQLKSSDDLNFQPGGFVANKGNLAESAPKLTCVISKDGSEIYKESLSPGNVDPDGVAGGRIDKVFNDVSKGEGRYSLSYSASSDKSEKYKSDNNYNTYFNFSNAIISKSRFSFDNRAPVFSGAYYFGGGTAYREYMMPFRLEFGAGLKIDSIYANVLADIALAGAYLEGRIYRWDDANSDGTINTEEMTLVALGTYTFDDNVTSTSATVRMPLENLDGADPIYTVPKDGDLYFGSIQYAGGSHSMFFGYDHDFNQRIDFLAKEDAQTLDIVDYPYLNTSTQASSGGPDMDAAGLFYFDCDGSGANEDETVYSPIDIAVHIQYVVATKDVKGANFKVDLLSNPVNEVLNVKVELNNSSKVTYQIINTLGVVIDQQTERVNTSTVKSFNVQALTSGNYLISVNTENGKVTKPFTIIR